jgi:hypothetical protein
MSAVTAVIEEVLVNGYFITRLGQLGWTPRSSLLLSLTLRTSHPIYYGLGFFLYYPAGLPRDEIVPKAPPTDETDQGALPP